ncbi:hypothetical protein E2C01_011408 [Portunus trituberculatus]|uniref:Uncharacterized protein n=1 Tax=Portunus trituberculatus TaxID=210409 RepID=A0A5B7DB46_PORTR|nr:hypothetical protein [Portunus trituberculatus]
MRWWTPRALPSPLPLYTVAATHSFRAQWCHIYSVLTADDTCGVRLQQRSSVLPSSACAQNAFPRAGALMDRGALGTARVLHEGKGCPVRHIIYKTFRLVQGVPFERHGDTA